MDDAQWGRIADRIESTWPGEAGWGDSYRDELGGLSPEAVERALDDLLIEYRNGPPPPDVVRRHAAAIPADELAPPDPAGWQEAPAGAGEGAAPEPATPSHSRPAQEVPPESRLATVALILGAAGLVTVPIVVSVIAIVVANRALAEIEANPGLGGAQRARTGRLLGYIELTLVALTIVLGVVIALS